MARRVIELITSHGTLASPETVEYIMGKSDPEKYVKSILEKFSELPLFLTVEMLKEKEAELLEAEPADAKVDAALQEVSPSIPVELKPPQKEEPDPEAFGALAITPKREPEPKQDFEPEVISQLSSKRPLAKEYDADVQVLKDVTGQSTSEGTVNDFHKYFKTKFEILRKILHNQRREVMGSVDIAKVRDSTGPFKFVCIVNDVRETKQGHKILELEDNTDTISALVLNSSPLINMSFVKDEVLCVIGKPGKSDLVYVEDIIRPNVPIARNQNRSEEPLDCLFMADIHIGSNTFLHKIWDRFVRWLNGNHTVPNANSGPDRIKYMVIAGDIVDGIGVYPDQEFELEISDIYAQYEKLAEMFQNIPEHIKLIVLPGNHDAVRPAEPQPTFPKEITDLFSNDILFVGNPCYFTLNSVEVLAYHGRSMDDFVMQIPTVTYNQPLQIMKEMLVRRHLAPIYGNKTPIAPEHNDYLLIDRIPDIFVTGHIHKTAMEYYRDILLINASAWQSQTAYQKMMNFNPEPGNIILADLQSRKSNVIDFT
jgi:DNA polymerase II small subunit